jgi:cation:H+ antiporter
VRLLGALALGALGVALVVWGAEQLVKAARARAALMGVSALVMGLLATSADIESTAAGVAAARKGLETVAAGVSLGSVVFLATAALGVAAFLFPFSVRTPRSLIVAMIASALAAGLLLLDGTAGRLDGLGLVGLFGVLLFATSRQLRGQAQERPLAEGPVTTLVKTRTRFVVVVAGSLIAMSLGAELLADGAREALMATHLSETLVGMIVVSVALSLEEGLIEVLPAWRGVPEIAVGNVAGTTVFLLTASLGTVAIVHPLHLRSDAVSFHLPAMLGAVGLCSWALTRPLTGRREGAILVTYYVLYLVASWFVGQAPRVG